MALIPAQRIFHHVTAQETSVGELLKKHFHLGDERIRELLTLGCIYRNKVRVFEDGPLPRGAYLRLHLQPKRFPTDLIAWSERVVFQSKEFLVIHKPAGIPTHASVDNAVENCLFQMRAALKVDLYVTQRLDQPVSGLLLLAKSKKAQAQFNQWLSDRKIQKTYWALVQNEPQVGKHIHYMEPSERSPKRLSVEPKANWLVCELSILRVEPVLLDQQTFYQIEIQLHTGRTHQIRAQLAALGSPLVGDTLYGSRLKRWGSSRIGLAAVTLAWPTGGPITLSESVLKELWHHSK